MAATGVSCPCPRHSAASSGAGSEPALRQWASLTLGPGAPFPSLPRFLFSRNPDHRIGPASQPGSGPGPPAPLPGHIRAAPRQPGPRPSPSLPAPG